KHLLCRRVPSPDRKLATSRVARSAAAGSRDTSRAPPLRWRRHPPAASRYTANRSVRSTGAFDHTIAFSITARPRTRATNLHHRECDRPDLRRSRDSVARGIASLSPDHSPDRRLRPSHLVAYRRFSLVAYVQYAPRCASGGAPRSASRCLVSLAVLVNDPG